MFFFYWLRVGGSKVCYIFTITFLFRLLCNTTRGFGGNTTSTECPSSNTTEVEFYIEKHYDLFKPNYHDMRLNFFYNILTVNQIYAKSMKYEKNRLRTLRVSLGWRQWFLASLALKALMTKHTQLQIKSTPCQPHCQWRLLTSSPELVAWNRCAVNYRNNPPVAVIPTKVSKHFDCRTYRWLMGGCKTVNRLALWQLSLSGSLSHCFDINRKHDTAMPQCSRALTSE